MKVTNKALEIRVWNLVQRLIINTATSCEGIIVFLLQVTKPRWMGHVAGMGLVVKPAGKRSLGRPRLTWSDKTFRELIAVKLLRTSLLNTTVVAFKILPLGSYAPMPAPSPPFKTNLEMVLWNDLQSRRCITPDIINVIKMPSFQYFSYLREQKKVVGG